MLASCHYIALEREAVTGSCSSAVDVIPAADSKARQWFQSRPSRPPSRHVCRQVSRNPAPGGAVSAPSCR